MAKDKPTDVESNEGMDKKFSKHLRVRGAPSRDDGQKGKHAKASKSNIAVNEKEKGDSIGSDRVLRSASNGDGKTFEKAEGHRCTTKLTIDAVSAMGENFGKRKVMAEEENAGMAEPPAKRRRNVDKDKTKKSDLRVSDRILRSHDVMKGDEIENGKSKGKKPVAEKSHSTGLEVKRVEGAAKRKFHAEEELLESQRENTMEVDCYSSELAKKPLLKVGGGGPVETLQKQMNEMAISGVKKRGHELKMREDKKDEFKDVREASPKTRDVKPIASKDGKKSVHSQKRGNTKDNTGNAGKKTVSNRILEAETQAVQKTMKSSGQGNVEIRKNPPRKGQEATDQTR
ncbi:unnamed protein product [Ilex paraguariensis]|uniref:Uncharacterized protein n=1 Tax=Ilex paraguariensis TaxID=185542 RepID=A0ABC8SRA5_9AQUA